MSTARSSLSMAGFSLLELLVALVVIGVVMGAVLLATGGSLERQIENDARRAEMLIDLACERAMATGLDVGFRVAEDGLSFGYLRPQGWQIIDQDPADALRRRQWQSGVKLSAWREGRPLDADAAATEPQFVCFSSGELTPFELHIDSPDQRWRWRLSGAFDGSLQLSPNDDDAR